MHILAAELCTFYLPNRSIYIMRMCYGSFTGYSTAVALVLFLIVLIPVLVSLRFFRSVEFEA